MNNEVNAARETTKSHTLSLDTFKSLEFGPLGIVDNDRVIFYRNILTHEHIETECIEEKVALIKTYVGIDSDYINHCIDHHYKGFVIEAMGRGNIPLEMVEGVKRAIEAKLPVVIVSRCAMGRVLYTYGYEGGGKHLRQLGAIFGGNLNGQKARVKLMLLLGSKADMNDIKIAFEQNDYDFESV